MIARFFIDRPIFASALSIVITLLGLIAMVELPLTQYPLIVPPTVRVQAVYPGASAQEVSSAIAAPIEQQVNGVEDMLYMSSQCTNDGSYSLSVTFKPGVNLNFAQVLVQNRVSLALPALPDVVKPTLITRKRNPDILMIINVSATDGRYDQLYLSSYALINIKEELVRVDGVSDISMFNSQEYAMRVWVEPDKLAVRGLTASDVVKAVKEQNNQVAAGRLGSAPSTAGQALNLPLTTLGRRSLPEQFDDIILKSSPTGGTLRIKDIGHTELGAKSSDIHSFVDGKPCVNIAVFLLPDANALDTAERVRAKMQALHKNFPEGITHEIHFDTTPFVRESVNEVFKTLRDAIILVALVVLLFLQSWRSAIIPLLAVPVAIIGTFAVMAALGFSINNLTLFGLVLAIGIVVDDAIVVVEAVEHHMELGLPAREATIRAMEEVSGPVIAVGCVLSAVFVPCAFISGITGSFFRQFALTIAVSTLISMFNSLTLSPALCAILLKPRHAPKDPLAWLLNLLLGWFFRLFNFGFRKVGSLYTRLVSLSLRLSLIVLVLYAGLLGLTWWSFQQIPTGYIPAQDRGYLFLTLQMPESTALERTEEVVQKVEQMVLKAPGVSHTLSVAGQSFALSAYGSNFGQMFVILDDFHDRHDPRLHAQKIAAKLKAEVSAVFPDAVVAVFGPAPISGLGTSSGFRFLLEDRNDLGIEELQEQAQALIGKANEYRDPKGKPVVENVFTSFRANSPQLKVNVDRDKCAMLGVDVKEVYNTLQVYLGSVYVNDFNRFDRTWQVIVQASGEFRNQPESISRLQVRNDKGQMIPLGSLLSVAEINGPLLLTRYNMYPAITINGSTAPEVSTGQAIDVMQELARDDSLAYEWTEITFLQLQSGSTALLIFALSVVGVFLVLAALYESWTLPLAVILVVPLCLLGSLTGVALSQSDINIFTQVGFVVLVGLASKNAILIVEFAKLKRDAGVPRRQAILEACALRLRPILMTSLAFIFGVIPLMLSYGAGAEMRRVLGTAVFSGMVGVTLFGIFLTPVFFYVIDWFGEKSMFGSPAMKRLALVVGWTWGILAVLLVETLLAVAWLEGVLSLAGLVLLSVALVGVVALVLLAQHLQSGPTRAGSLPVFNLWPRRWRRSAPVVSRNGHVEKSDTIEVKPKP